MPANKQANRRELPSRLADLQRALELTDADFAALFKRQRNQAGAWRRGEQLPRWSLLEMVAQEQGWPVEIFQDGGPKPASVLNLAVNARPGRGHGIVAEARPVEPYGAGAVKGAALVALGDYLVPGAPFDVLQRLIDGVYEAGRAAGRSEQGGPLADGG